MVSESTESIPLDIHKEVALARVQDARMIWEANAFSWQDHWIDCSPQARVATAALMAMSGEPFPYRTRGKKDDPLDRWLILTGVALEVLLTLMNNHANLANRLHYDTDQKILRARSLDELRTIPMPFPPSLESFNP